MKAIKPQTTQSCWGELCPDVPCLFRRTRDRAEQGGQESTCGLDKRACGGGGGGGGLQDTDLGEIQDLPDATAKELREAALTEMGAS